MRFRRSGNSLILSIVNVLTRASAIISTMILSHSLELKLYGTYSQTNLLVTTATSLCALGLIDSMNYFFNKSSNPKIQARYVNTIMGLQVLFGAAAGIILILFADGITAYFDNPYLRGFLPLLAFRPMFVNLNVGMQYLHISIGRAASAAIRSGTMAVLRIAVVSVTAFISQDITIILIAYLLFEIFFAVSFYMIFGKECFYIHPLQIDVKLIREILSYSIPMGIYIITNTLNRDIDKILIGRWYSTEVYAVYANCATLLPFGIIASSFMTILIPTMTKCFGRKDYESARELFRNYLKIGYYTSVAFTIPFIILSREAILVLYGKNYLGGQLIFILYIFVSTLQFANMSFVLSACGKTRTLMYISVLSLPLNLLLNIIGNKVMGITGPACATVLVTALTTSVLLCSSADALHCGPFSLFDAKDLLQIAAKLLLIGGAAVILTALLRMLELPALVILALAGGFFVGIFLLSNLRRLKVILYNIDQLK